MVDFKAMGKAFKKAEEASKNFFEGKKVGYEVHWEEPTVRRELEEGEGKDTEYFGLNEIKGNDHISGLLHSKKAVVDFCENLDKKQVEPNSMRICAFYLNERDERDRTLPYEGFKGYESYTVLKEELEC